MGVASFNAPDLMGGVLQWGHGSTRTLLVESGQNRDVLAVDSGPRPQGVRAVPVHGQARGGAPAGVYLDPWRDTCGHGSVSQLSQRGQSGVRSTGSSLLSNTCREYGGYASEGPSSCASSKGRPALDPATSAERVQGGETSAGHVFGCNCGGSAQAVRLTGPLAEDFSDAVWHIEISCSPDGSLSDKALTALFGGKPSPGTPADKRLTRNKPGHKGGTKK